MADIAFLGWLGLLLTLAGELTALMLVRDLKRMLIASSIAELGFVFMAIGVGTLTGEAGALLHLGYQIVMRMLVILAAWRIVRAAGSSRLDDLVGSVARQPFAALMFGFGMFSVMGLSPFKGALSKFIILYAAIESGNWLLAIGGTVASIFGAIYFIRTIQVVCFQRRDQGVLHDAPIPFFALSARDAPMVVLALATIVMSLFPEPFLHLAAHAVGLAGLPEFETSWSLPVLLPYIGGFLLFVLGRFSTRLRAVGVGVVAAATVAAVLAGFRTGDLGDLFALLFAGIGLAVAVYSIRYIEHSHAANRYFFFLFLMIGSLIGVATSDHLGNFYLFWELMTWSSYLLVIHEQTEKALKAGAKYFLICVSGSYVMHFGILLLHAELGTFEIGEIAARIGDLSPAMSLLIVGTFLVGLGAKAGIFPLHSWLPDAHPVAPSSISGPMSAILTKAGVFGIVKLLFVMFAASSFAAFGAYDGLTSPGLVLIVLGGATFLIGEIQAFRQSDVKRLLAYSTLAQVGEITMVIGIGTSLALTGALVHVANHAVMKTLLFFCVGALILGARGQTLDALRGIGRAMPFTALCLGIGLLAIMAVPPFGGFVGKFLMIYASVEAGHASVAFVLLFGGVIGAMYYARILRVVFFMPYSGPRVAEAPLSMRMVLAALAGLAILTGLYPDALLALVTPVVDALADRSGLGAAVLPPLTMQWSLAAGIAAAGSLAVYWLGRDAPVRAGVLSVAVTGLALATVLLQAERYDGLSFWYAVLIAGVGAVNLFYSIGYMAHGHAQNRFFFFFVAMIAGLLGLTGSSNLFSFFAFWEVMSSWTLYLVITHEETPEARREGTKYFVFNMAGASFLFLGVTMLAARAGTFELAALADAVAGLAAAHLVAPCALIFAGFLMKAAMIPVRIDYQMHPASAPTPVSGYISAVLLKVGHYGMLKIFAVLGAGALFARMADLSPWMPNLMQVSAVIAAVTLLYAGAMAVIENGIKRLLIYSTVSQLGYVLLGLSLATPLGIAGGLMHAVNHMLLKDVLFLVAGCILAQGHVRSLDELGGLGQRMPVTFAIFLFAGLSLAGIPPLNGFSSKWLLYQAAFEGGHYLMGLAALMSSLFTLAAVLKFAHTAFMGQLSPAAARMSEAPAVMLAPMLLLVGASIVFGALPGLVLVPVAHVQASLGLTPVEASWLGPLPGPQPWHPLTLTLALLAVGLIGVLYVRLSGSRRVKGHIHVCGVTDIAAERMHVPASALYETPDRLIRGLLHIKPKAESPAHD